VIISSAMVSLVLVLAMSVILVATGLQKQPGIGILGVLLIIGLALWLRGEGLVTLGFAPPESWSQTVLLGMVLGIGIQLVGVLVIEPLSEKITGTRHDHSIIENVRGNWRVFLRWLVLVWVFVPVLEEGLYRGFLMTETARVAGTGTLASIVNVFFSSLVFGLSHGYQGRAGIVSTSLVGVFLGVIFVLSGFNLWLAIFTHGFIDTVGIALIAVDGDKYIQRRLWGHRGE
jgi:uncharacterized protein